MPSSKSRSSKSASSEKMSSRSKSLQKNQNREKKRSRTPQNEKRRRSRSNDRHRSPPRRYQPAIIKSAKLFVTNIDSKYLTQQVRSALESQFSKFGQIKQITVKTSTGSANSYAFIEFSREEDAEKALNEMRDKEFKGRELKVEYGRGHRKDQDRRSDKCFICHKQGHFAKDCRYRDRSRDDKYGGDRDYYPRRRRHSSSDSRSPRRKRSYDRDRDRDYRRRDDRQYRRSPRRSPRRQYRSDRRERY